MISFNRIESEITNKNKNELISWLIQKNMLEGEKICSECNNYMELKPYKRNKDGKAWRCLKNNCKNHLKYFSIRFDSFFEDFKIELVIIIRIIIKFANNEQQTTVKTFFFRN
ncbi:hypothetical protein GVAV_000932 [Gurleya vavrai]